MFRQRYPDAPGMHNMPSSYNEDVHRRTTYRENPSFLKRLKDSLVTTLFGVALIVVACVLLFWNEGRAVRTARSLDEGLRFVRPLESADTVFQENDQKLVHLNGQLMTKKALVDPMYSIGAHAVKFRRRVEMYQWVETEHSRAISNEGERTRTETTYSYALHWRSEVIRSMSFANPSGHHNPTTFAVQPTLFQADKAYVGGFTLSPELVGRISEFHRHAVRQIHPDPTVHIHDGMYYHGVDPLNPQVGDLRVWFEYAGRSGEEDSDTISVVAKQDGGRLTKYQTEAGDVLAMLYLGRYTAHQMFGNEHAQNTILSWGVRFGGWFLCFLAFQCLAAIINTLVDWLPIVREVVMLGTALMSATLSISLSLTVIALGWIAYRPWLGISILVAAAAPLVLSKLRARPAQPAQPPPSSARGYYD